MNFLRQGRVLIPPFLLLVSWWWMQVGDQALSLQSIPKIEVEKLTLLLALLGAAALPAEAGLRRRVRRVTFLRSPNQPASGVLANYSIGVCHIGSSSRFTGRITLRD